MKNTKEILKRLEDEGHCYNGVLRIGGLGTFWVDEKNKKLYEFKTDDLDFISDDFDEEELMEIEEQEL